MSSYCLMVVVEINEYIYPFFLRYCYSGVLYTNTVQECVVYCLVTLWWFTLRAAPHVRNIMLLQCLTQRFPAYILSFPPTAYQISIHIRPILSVSAYVLPCMFYPYAITMSHFTNFQYFGGLFSQACFVIRCI